MKQSVLTVLLAGIMLTFGSCIAENRDDCPPILEPLRLLVTTDHENMQETRAYVSIGERTTQTAIEDWYTCIENVVVYVFQENANGDNIFVKHWEGPVYTIFEEYEVPLEELALPEGVYNFVVWTNHGEDHKHYVCNLGDLKGDTIHHDEFKMTMNVPESREFLEDLTHRHHGVLESVNLSRNALKRTNEIEITPNTHKINFTVVGVEAEGYSADDELQVTITDKNVSHDFTNTFIEGHVPYTHIRTLEAPATAEETTRADGLSSLSASMVIMQVHDDTGTSFDITDKATGESLLGGPVDIVNMITVASEGAVDFDYTREFDITVPFQANVGPIIIQINGWTYRLNRTQL